MKQTIEIKTKDDPYPDVGMAFDSCIVHNVPVPVGTKLRITIETIDERKDKTNKRPRGLDYWR